MPIIEKAGGFSFRLDIIVGVLLESLCLYIG